MQFTFCIYFIIYYESVISNLSCLFVWVDFCIVDFFLLMHLHLTSKLFALMKNGNIIVFIIQTGSTNDLFYIN